MVYAFVLYQSLPCQLNFPYGFTLFEPTLAHTSHTSFSKLDFLLNSRECAGTMVREVYTGEGMRAEISIAVS